MRPADGLRLGLAGAGLFLMACGSPRPGQDDDDAKPPAASSALAQIGEETGIVLDQALVSRIGLRTLPLLAATRAPEQELAAVVVDDPGAEITIRAGVTGRVAEAEGRSWPRLGERLAPGEVIAQVGDARPITAPKGGTVTRLTTQPGELVQAGQELLTLVDYSAPLVQVGWVDGTVPPPEVTFTTLGGSQRFRGRLIGASPQADPATRGPASLYRVGTAAALRPGMALLARVPDPRGARRGVVVPASAVVQWDALAWTFVERAPGRYVRVRVPTDYPVPDGWLVERGLAVGDRVVTVGASQLLSEEFRARIVVGEEVGE